MRAPEERRIYKVRTNERWGDGPRAGQDCGASTMFVMVKDWQVFGQGSWSVEGCGRGGGRASDPVVPTE